ncbi:MAG: hypothetical protein V4492_04115 [Chlamydiota bacterium]
MAATCTDHPNVFTYLTQHLPQKTFYLAVSSDYPQIQPLKSLKKIFDRLLPEQKTEAYHLHFELAQRENSRTSAVQGSPEHFWDEPQKAARVMHRLGLLGSEGCVEIRYNLEITLRLDLSPGPIKPTSFYYSLSDKLGRDPHGGWISYVNGMSTLPKNAGTDANKISDLLAEGSNLHCVYLPTQRELLGKDMHAVALDFFRLLAVNGGGYTRTSCLIVQQWIDYLSENPDKNFLQTCHSEGAVHINAALRILRNTKPDYLGRLNILTFCPARIILPLSGEPLKAVNFVKLEDPVPSEFAEGKEILRSETPYAQIILHTDKHNPHDPTSPDYIAAAKPYFDRFMSTGSICEKEVTSSSMINNLK